MEEHIPEIQLKALSNLSLIYEGKKSQGVCKDVRRFRLTFLYHSNTFSLSISVASKAGAAGTQTRFSLPCTVKQKICKLGFFLQDYESFQFVNLFSFLTNIKIFIANQYWKRITYIFCDF